MTAISPKLSKLLALALMGCLASAAINLAVLPVAERWNAAQFRLADAAAWRDRLGAAVQRIPDTEAALARLRETAGQRSGVLRVANESLGAAELQKIVQKVVGSSGLSIRSIQTLATKRENGALQLGARVSAGGPESSLPLLLETVSRHNPALAVRHLIVGSRNSGSSLEARGMDTMIDVQMDFEIMAMGDQR